MCLWLLMAAGYLGEGCQASHHPCVASTPVFLSILLAISRWTWVSWYYNVSIVDFIGAKGDGGSGNNWSYKACKALVIMSPPTNIHPLILQAGCPSCHLTNSVKALKGKIIIHYFWQVKMKQFCWASIGITGIAKARCRQCEVWCWRCFEYGESGSERQRAEDVAECREFV